MEREGGNASIFSRINFLLEAQEKKGDNKHEHKGELLITLITSFYLNLARNEENVPFLLSLNLFKRLNKLMTSTMKHLAGEGESTSLCYTNTIFSKLLKNASSREQCIKEGGYQLFISILQSKNTHLFLETLDSIKLFLTRREYLDKFNLIPKCITLSTECKELNVSFLQVIAILSFEKKNHAEIKANQILAKLEEMKMFDNMFAQFEGDVEEEKKPKPRVKQTVLEALKGESEVAAVDEDKEIELALAISIILANLSCEEDFIYTLLGVAKWKRKSKSAVEESKQDHSSEHSPALMPEEEDYDDARLVDLPEVKRITRLLNLLSHENPFISE